MSSEAIRTLEFRRALTVPVEHVWRTIAAIGGVDQWFPVIKTCRVEGQGVGARRYCEMSDGTKLKETVTAIDHERQTFKYTIDEGLPVRSYEGEMQVLDGRGSKPELVWTVTLRGDTEPVEAMAGMLDQMASVLFDGLFAFARKRSEEVAR